jgi:hypothetical protein
MDRIFTVKPRLDFTLVNNSQGDREHSCYEFSAGEVGTVMIRSPLPDRSSEPVFSRHWQEFELVSQMGGGHKLVANKPAFRMRTDLNVLAPPVKELF